MIQIAWSPEFCHPLPSDHRFPMIKYSLIRQQLLWEGIIMEGQLFKPNPIEVEEVIRAHSRTYLAKLQDGLLTAKEQRALGFPLSRLLVERELLICQGTLQCAIHALGNGLGLNIAGGTHHAFRDKGEGFCLLNDFAVALCSMLDKALIKKALIIDLDVHQGNGSAALFASDTRVFTFSMHGAHNYPFKKEKSDWDIPLADGTSDSLYLQLLEDALPKLVEKVRPDLVCYQSGVDILATDKFGKLNISLEGCRTRDELVFNYLAKKNIPCVVAMGGGYSTELKAIVNAHCETFKAALNAYA